MKNKSVFLLDILVALTLMIGLSILIIKTFGGINIFQKSIDSIRVKDLENLNHILKFFSNEYPKFNELKYASSNTIYISLPDSYSDCSSWLNELPALPSGWSYRCSQNPQNIDGTGWIPIPFDLSPSLNVHFLPVDPINKPPYYYAFIAGRGYKITAKLDIMKEFSINDGGNDPLVYEVGDNLKLPSIQYGLILFFPFNERAGTIVYDRSGFENNGVLINFNFNTSSGWTTDEGRDGIILDGIDDYISTTKLLINIPTSEIFIGTWINFKEKKDGDFILYTGATTGNGIDMYFKGPTSENPKIMTRFKVVPISDLKVLSSNSPDLNQWYFITVNFKKPHVNVYFYPNLEVSGLFNTSTIFSKSLKIGSSTSKFIIDGIRIYSKALTVDEIKILYENYTKSF